MKKEEFDRALEKLSSMGFRVYRNKGYGKDSYLYAVFTDGVNLGYIQPAKFFNLLHLSTVHKPCRTYGTGFYVGEVSVDALTRKVAEKAFVDVPAVFGRADVKKYRDFKDWREHSLSSSLYDLKD